MKKFFVTMIALCVGSMAHAGFLLEPYLGYSSGSMSAETIASAKTDSSGSGASYGAKVGYKFNGGFWAAADVYMGSHSFTSNSVSLTVARATTYLDVGYDFSNRVGLFLGYGLSDKTTVTQSGLSDVDYTGTTIRAGFGYQWKPWLKTNLEYISHTYSKVSVSGIEFDLSTLYKTMTDSEVLLTFNFPIGGSK